MTPEKIKKLVESYLVELCTFLADKSTEGAEDVAWILHAFSPESLASISASDSFNVRDEAFGHLANMLNTDVRDYETIFGFLSDIASEKEKLVFKTSRNHGLDSDPDHEVGDLQDAFRGAFLMLDTERQAKIMMKPTVNSAMPGNTVNTSCVSHVYAHGEKLGKDHCLASEVNFFRDCLNEVTPEMTDEEKFRWLLFTPISDNLHWY